MLTLLHRHRFRQITRLVDVAAAFECHVVTEQLDRDTHQDWRYDFMAFGNSNNLVDGTFGDFATFGRDADDLAFAGFDFL